MRTIQIGKLNKRVTLLRLGDTTDRFNQKKKELTTIATVWADFYPLRGAELYEVQKIQGRMTHKCYIRYSDVVADLSSNDLISFAGKDYLINSAANVDMENKMLEIYCSEHTGKEGYDHGS